MFAMDRRTLHTLELGAAIAGQTVLLGIAWGFFGVVFYDDPLVVSDYFANLVNSRPTETTWITTLIATIFSVTTTTCLSIAFKEALRHRMRRSISLIHLSGGIALARNSFFINFRHPIPAMVTLAVFGATKLLVSSWTALLAPTPITWTAPASSLELDLTSSWFETMLQQELVQSGAALVRGNSTQIVDLDGVLSGIAAAEFNIRTPGIFDFNGAKYNRSTGGILPAVQEYAGTTQPVPENNTGLAFAGGSIPTYLEVDFPKGRVIQGLRHQFTLLQQGLTADVTCQPSNGTGGNVYSSYYPLPVPYPNGTTNYWLWAWNITADCSQGQPSQQTYVTRSNSSTVPDSSSTALISSVVCPYPLGQTGLPWEQFTVFTNATGRYNFLPQTFCTISPVVTTSFVNYSRGAINTTVISSQLLGSSNRNLTQFLAAIVDYQSRTAQSLSSNSIGDALYSIYISALDSNSSNPEDVANYLVRETERYWRGVIEFSGTFLRSAFSVNPLVIPAEAQIAVTGNETITTIGWYRRSPVWAYTTIPITVVAFMFYTAVAYTLWNVFSERGHESFTEVDPSNPIHVMMVSSARDRSEANDNLDDYLAGFERGGIGKNENTRVQLMNVDAHRKRFRVVKDREV